MDQNFFAAVFFQKFAGLHVCIFSKNHPCGGVIFKASHSKCSFYVNTSLYYKKDIINSQKKLNKIEKEYKNFCMADKCLFLVDIEKGFRYNQF